LPKDEALHPTRSLHNGRHVTTAIETIAERMDDIVRKGKSEGWSQAQYKEALEKMLSKERPELKAGNVPLNKHMRPWAGAPDAPGE
jgi:hypothetical protein